MHEPKCKQTGRNNALAMLSPQWRGKSSFHDPGPNPMWPNLDFEQNWAGFTESEFWFFSRDHFVTQWSPSALRVRVEQNVKWLRFNGTIRLFEAFWMIQVFEKNSEHSKLALQIWSSDHNDSNGANSPCPRVRTHIPELLANLNFTDRVIY